MFLANTTSFVLNLKSFMFFPNIAKQDYTGFGVWLLKTLSSGVWRASKIFRYLYTRFECSVVLPKVTRNRLYNFSSVTVVSKVVFVCSVSVSCCFFSLFFFFCQYTSRLDILLVYFPHVKAVHCIDKPSKSLTALQLRSL